MDEAESKTSHPFYGYVRLRIQRGGERERKQLKGREMFLTVVAVEGVLRGNSI